jgi:hypothetical protein
MNDVVVKHPVTLLNEMAISDTTTETVSPLRVVRLPLMRDAAGCNPSMK